MNIVQIIMIVIILGAASGSTGYIYSKMSRKQKIANIKEWLKYAVIEAEKYLGSGTGQLKLRYVYDAAVKQFPWIVSLVSFQVFSAWVDDALDWMKDQLKNNPAIVGYTIPKE